MILIGEPTQRPAWRHGQDRAARLGQHVDRGSRARRAMSLTPTAPTIRCRRSRGWSPRSTRFTSTTATTPSRRRTSNSPTFRPRRARPTSFPDRPRRGSTSASTISSAAPTWSSWSRKSPSARRRGSKVSAKISGEAFLTPPGELYDLVVGAIAAETGIEPNLSTGGGTSDGRYLIQLCPVVDFGLPNATMHKFDEMRGGRGHPRADAHLSPRSLRRSFA